MSHERSRYTWQSSSSSSSWGLRWWRPAMLGSSSGDQESRILQKDKARIFYIPKSYGTSIGKAQNPVFPFYFYSYRVRSKVKQKQEKETDRRRQDETTGKNPWNQVAEELQ